MDAQQGFRPDLLDSVTDGAEVPTTFAACLNAHGLYNSMQFVLRLSPKVHRLVLEATSPTNWTGQSSVDTQSPLCA